MKEAVVNELSAFKFPDILLPAGEDEREAKTLMSSFVTCANEGFRLGLLTSLRTAREFAALELASGYPIARWMSDRTVNRDERVRFARFATSSPYLEDHLEETSYCGCIAKGFGCCVLNRSLAISWGSDPRWRSTQITVDVLRLTDEGEPKEGRETLRNASDHTHWAELEGWIRSDIAAGIRTGEELIAVAPKLFPRVRFGSTAIRQISALSGTEPYFRWLVNALLSANSEVSLWDGGAFPHGRLPGPATGESGPVRDSPRLRAMRVFPTDEGRTEFMEHHMKNLGENRRMHYFLDGNRRVIVIGYFGEHVETAQY